MDRSEVTITLPMSGHGLGVIVTALGIALATGFVFLILREQERKTERAPLALLIAFGWLVVPVWVVLFAGTLWQVWLILSGGDSSLVGAGRLGAGALLAALLGAPFVIWGTVLRHQTVRYQKEGHITDRINKAVEQLGAEKEVKRHLVNSYGKKVYEKGRDREPDFSNPVITETSEPSIEVRIGAILSLERIAQDSTIHDKGRDHVRVMEILCAYVRENAPASEAPDFPFPQGCKQDTIDEKRKSTPSWLSNETTLRADVQLALSVIGRRTPEQVRVERDHFTQDGVGYRIDLSRTNLRYADLQYLNFEKANFFRSQMQGAFCKGGIFKSANFTHCELTGISAESANFSNAKLQISDFSHAYLKNASFWNCKLAHTHFVRANMQAARIRFCKNVDTRETNRAFFVDSDLKGALIQGDLLGVIFALEVRPSETIPRDICNTAFRAVRVGLTYQNFHKFHHMSAIPEEWLCKTFGDASVSLSENFNRPDHWPSWELPETGKHAFDTEWRKWLSDPDGYTPPPKPEG